MLKKLEKKQFKMTEIRGVQDRRFYYNVSIFGIFKVFLYFFTKNQRSYRVLSKLIIIDSNMKSSRRCKIRTRKFSILEKSYFFLSFLDYYWSGVGSQLSISWPSFEIPTIDTVTRLELEIGIPSSTSTTFDGRFLSELSN
jgi:hypothetical protein